MKQPAFLSMRTLAGKFTEPTEQPQDKRSGDKNRIVLLAPIRTTELPTHDPPKLLTTRLHSRLKERSVKFEICKPDLKDAIVFRLQGVMHITEGEENWQEAKKHRVTEP
ncbi:hypothetical protein F2Q70_00045650 [Brassica cretica]|uniref:Uncharacterized protein n=1 Tax=Brassica cretica TaxID=69181 RepID=A0A8S9KIU0_BRACR|nr:hypothetical protein F2Q70_00045650 [Brassica cretica]